MSIIDDLRIQDDLMVYLYGNITVDEFGIEVSQIAATFPDKSSDYIDRQLAILERKFLIELDRFYADDSLKAKITDIGCDYAEQVLLERHGQKFE